MTFVYLICFILLAIGAILILGLTPERITEDIMRFASPKQTLREKEVVEMERANENIQFLFTHTNTTSYLETLTAQQSLLSAQLALINDKYSKVQAAINLYQALGGGHK